MPPRLVVIASLLFLSGGLVMAVEMTPVAVPNPPEGMTPEEYADYLAQPETQNPAALSQGVQVPMTPVVSMPDAGPRGPVSVSTARRAQAGQMSGGSGSLPIRTGEMLFNFQDVEIGAVVKALSQVTQRNFLIDPRVKGRLTIISAKPVSKAAAYEIFVSALKAQGFTAVEGPGGVVKIIPEADAKPGARVQAGSRPYSSDQWITQVLSVKNASATQLVTLLRPLMSPSAVLSVYAPANILVMTDTANSVRNVLKVIEQIDQPGSSDVNVITLKYASALDVSQLVSRFADGTTMPGQISQPGQGDSRLIIVPDLRTNSLLVRSDNPARIGDLKSLVAKLDVPARQGGNTHVTYLRNAEAVKLADILRGLMQGEARAAQAAPISAVPGQPAIAGIGARGVENSLVQADEATNALIISAPDAVYNNLRAVIEKLDVRRAQVYVEALIVEVTSDRATQFGIQWAGGVPGAGDSKVAAGTNFTLGGDSLLGTVLSGGASLAGTAGLIVGYVGDKVTLPDGRQVHGLGALARALESDSHANILSTPNLVTLDNAEAKIVVGQNVPFLTGSFSSTGASGGAGVNPFQTVERKDVGLTLKIKPQISEGGGVKMQIFQEVSSVARAATAQAQDLITNKRSLETTVIVDDSHIMVLGGLIEDKVNDSVQGVPLLSRIPLLGELFKYRDRNKAKTHLMVFLRPVIVRSSREAELITTDRYEYLRAHQKGTTRERDAMMERFDPRKAVKPETPYSKEGPAAPVVPSPPPAM